MRKLFARLEGLILVLVGAGAGWFALAGDYALLMNPAYRWLTVSGAIAVFVLGIGALGRPRSRPRVSSVAVFTALILLVAIGRPDDRSRSAFAPPPPPADRETVIDGVEYTPVDLVELGRIVDGGKKDMTDRPLLVHGIARRVPALEQDGHFAIVRPIMACCLADAILVGFRAELTGTLDLGDREAWVNLYGRLRRTAAPLARRNFRLGALRFAMLDEHHVFVPVRVSPYLGFQPKETLVDRLSGGRFRIFLDAIERAGWKEKLTKEGPYTVFAPVDEAFTSSPKVDPATLSADRLRQLVEDHIVAGDFRTPELLDHRKLTAISGRKLETSVVNGVYRVEASRLLFKNTRARNGTVHSIFPALGPRPEDARPGRPGKGPRRAR